MYIVDYLRSPGLAANQIQLRDFFILSAKSARVDLNPLAYEDAMKLDSLN